MTDTNKDICLMEELEASYKLIVAGLGDLQEIDMENDFYHLPQQSLASGLERLMKCYICLVYEARNSRYPDFRYVKDLGHDLSGLRDRIVSEFYTTNGIPLLEDDLSFITTDARLQKIVHILSEFGKFARYYNLDVVTGNQNLPINPTEEWEALENEIEDMMPYSGPEAFESLHRDYYPRVHSQIIAKLERFVRAIAMQFTLGGHGGKLQQFSTFFTPFRNLQDDKLGTTDYRRSVKVLQREKKNWRKRTNRKLRGSKWPTKVITQSAFTGTWPFHADRVVIECRESMFCIVNIHGYDFALNGSAASRFSLPFPHDAGEAVLGRSIGPFIDMARDLGIATK